MSACTVQNILTCSYKEKQYKTNASRLVRNQSQRKCNNKNLSVSEAEFEEQGILKIQTNSDTTICFVPNFEPCLRLHSHEMCNWNN